MRTVFKYNINHGWTKVEMPKGAKIFSADYDGMKKLSVWAALDTETKETEIKTIFVIGTGWNLPDLDVGYSYKFIDTIVRADGLVLHAFEVIEGSGCKCL